MIAEFFMTRIRNFEAQNQGFQDKALPLGELPPSPATGG